MIISPSTHKPLYLFHLLHTLSISSALCFTKSVESATRLAKLVEFFEAARVESGGEAEGKKVVVKAYSSELAPGERKKVLKDFKAGEIQMYVTYYLHFTSYIDSVADSSYLIKAHLFRSHFSRYRYFERFACHLLRRSYRYAKVRTSCWTYRSCWTKGRSLEFGRGSRGTFLRVSLLSDISAID